MTCFPRFFLFFFIFIFFVMKIFFLFWTVYVILILINDTSILWAWVTWAGFTYSAAQGLVAELKSREEYESCDVSNPIKMYTEGLHTLPLEREGIRYFASSEPKNCKNGLKLHVEVLPKDSPSPSPTTLTVQAAGPTTPSSSASYSHSTTLALMVMLFCVTIMGLAY